VRVLHVLRKPLSEGTVAANTLKHGTGGMNINASRIASPGERIETTGQGRGENGFAANAVYGNYRGGFETHQTEGQKLGRWPANVILQHLDGCRCAGVKRVVNRSGKASGPTKDALGDGVRYGTANGERGKVPFYGGDETVANWICESGCPVARLDAESLVGGMHSAGSSRSAKREAGKTGMFPMDGDGHRFGDKGGASRFYKQVGGSK
jgi:hypothetical protein